MPATVDDGKHLFPHSSVLNFSDIGWDDRTNQASLTGPQLTRPQQKLVPSTAHHRQPPKSEDAQCTSEANSNIYNCSSETFSFSVATWDDSGKHSQKEQSGKIEENQVAAFKTHEAFQRFRAVQKKFQMEHQQKLDEEQVFQLPIHQVEHPDNLTSSSGATQGNMLQDCVGNNPSHALSSRKKRMTMTIGQATPRTNNSGNFAERILANRKGGDTRDGWKKRRESGEKTRGSEQVSNIFSQALPTPPLQVENALSSQAIRSEHTGLNLPTIHTSNTTPTVYSVSDSSRIPRRSSAPERDSFCLDRNSSALARRASVSQANPRHATISLSEAAASQTAKAFSFEIKLEPESSVSPLSNRDSVIAKMLSANQRKPPMEYVSQRTPSKQRNTIGKTGKNRKELMASDQNFKQRGEISPMRPHEKRLENKMPDCDRNEDNVPYLKGGKRRLEDTNIFEANQPNDYEGLTVDNALVKESSRTKSPHRRNSVNTVTTEKRAISPHRDRQSIFEISKSPNYDRQTLLDASLPTFIQHSFDVVKTPTPTCRSQSRKLDSSGHSQRKTSQSPVPGRKTGRRSRSLNTRTRQRQSLASSANSNSADAITERSKSKESKGGNKSKSRNDRSRSNSKRSRRKSMDGDVSQEESSTSRRDGSRSRSETRRRRGKSRGEGNSSSVVERHLTSGHEAQTESNASGPTRETTREDRVRSSREFIREEIGEYLSASIKDVLAEVRSKVSKLSEKDLSSRRPVDKFRPTEVEALLEEVKNQSNTSKRCSIRSNGEFKARRLSDSGKAYQKELDKDFFITDRGAEHIESTSRVKRSAKVDQSVRGNNSRPSERVDRLQSMDVLLTEVRSLANVDDSCWVAIDTSSPVTAMAFLKKTRALHRGEDQSSSSLVLDRMDSKGKSNKWDALRGSMRFIKQTKKKYTKDRRRKSKTGGAKDDAHTPHSQEQRRQRSSGPVFHQKLENDQSPSNQLEKLQDAGVVQNSTKREHKTKKNKSMWEKLRSGSDFIKTAKKRAETKGKSKKKSSRDHASTDYPKAATKLPASVAAKDAPSLELVTKAEAMEIMSQSKWGKLRPVVLFIYETSRRARKTRARSNDFFQMTDAELNLFTDSQTDLNKKETPSSGSRIFPDTNGKPAEANWESLNKLISDTKKRTENIRHRRRSNGEESANSARSNASGHRKCVSVTPKLTPVVLSSRRASNNGQGFASAGKPPKEKNKGKVSNQVKPPFAFSNDNISSVTAVGPTSSKRPRQDGINFWTAGDEANLAWGVPTANATVNQTKTKVAQTSSCNPKSAATKIVETKQWSGVTLAKELINDKKQRRLESLTRQKHLEEGSAASGSDLSNHLEKCANHHDMESIPATTATTADDSKSSVFSNHEPDSSFDASGDDIKPCIRRSKSESELERIEVIGIPDHSPAGVTAKKRKKKKVKQSSTDLEYLSDTLKPTTVRSRNGAQHQPARRKDGNPFQTSTNIEDISPNLESQNSLAFWDDEFPEPLTNEIEHENPKVQDKNEPATASTKISKNKKKVSKWTKLKGGMGIVTKTKRKSTKKSTGESTGNTGNKKPNSGKKKAGNADGKPSNGKKKSRGKEKSSDKKNSGGKKVKSISFSVPAEYNGAAFQSKVVVGEDGVTRVVLEMMQTTNEPSDEQ